MDADVAVRSFVRLGGPGRWADHFLRVLVIDDPERVRVRDLMTRLDAEWVGLGLHLAGDRRLASREGAHNAIYGKVCNLSSSSLWGRRRAG